MNAMTEALQTAGVKLPSQTERVWKLVYDFPGSNARTLAAKANMPIGSVHVALNTLKKREMVRSTIQREKRRGGLGVVNRDVSIFYAWPGMTKYELKPEVKTKVVKPETTPVRSAELLATAAPAQPKMQVTFATTLIQNHQALAQVLGEKHNLLTMSAVEVLQVLAREHKLIKIEQA